MNMPFSPIIVLTCAGSGIGGILASLPNATNLPLVWLPRPCSYGNKTAAFSTLRSAEILFTVSAKGSPSCEDEHRAFVATVHAAGVRHVVYLLLEKAPTFTLVNAHAVTETLIRQTGMAHTFLRDNLYGERIGSLASENAANQGQAGNDRVAQGRCGQSRCPRAATRSQARCPANLLYLRPRCTHASRNGGMPPARQRLSSPLSGRKH